MNELIKISEENGRRVVSGRELHKGLGIKTRFDTWFGRMCEYGFEENIDYILITQKVDAQKRARTYEQIDYAITLDMAKEISMIQRNEIGRKYRQYFIECEKKLKEVVKTSKLTREDELALKIIGGKVDAFELKEYKDIVKLKAIDGNNLVLTCGQVVNQLQYNVPNLTTTILNNFLADVLRLGEYKRFGKDKKRTFQPNEDYLKFVSGEGHAVTGKTNASGKITMYYTSSMVARIVKHHMGSLIEYANAKMIA